MPHASEPIKVHFNGNEISFRQSDSPLVSYWRTRYLAKTLIEWTPDTGDPLWHAPDSDAVTFAFPRANLTKAGTVWAVPMSLCAAFGDALLIELFASANEREEFEALRSKLVERGYPEGILASVCLPE